MDPELKSVLRRYSIVALVLGGTVVWTVWYVRDNAHENVAPAVVATTPQEPPTPESELQAQPRSEEHEKKKLAPSIDSLIVREASGARHVACAPACRFEEYCELRAVDECMKTSCDGANRVLSRSDFELVQADDCAVAAAAPCEEACWKKGECAGDHTTDKQCTDACKAMVKQLPAATFRESRCVIETKQCADLATCSRRDR